jgi:hypothetical protein
MSLKVAMIAILTCCEAVAQLRASPNSTQPPITMELSGCLAPLSDSPDPGERMLAQTRTPMPPAKLCPLLVPESVLEFGVGLDGDSRSATLLVHNVSPAPLILDAFSFGDNVLAMWELGIYDKPPSTRIALPKGAAGKLNIKALIDSKVDHVPLITISREGTVLASIALDYTLVAQETIDVRNMQVLPSGLGEWWSPYYELCLGPAPPHRTYVAGSADFHMVSNDHDHPRNCGAWAVCEMQEEDDDNVCMAFSIQGHHQPDSLFNKGEDKVIYVQNYLKARYKLVADNPTVVNLTKATSQTTLLRQGDSSNERANNETDLVTCDDRRSADDRARCYSQGSRR